MRSLQLLLNRSWNQVDNSSLVQWDDSCHRDRDWWLDPTRLGGGCLCRRCPRTSTSGPTLGRGARLAEEVVSGLWSPKVVSLSINTRELLAVERGLLHFQDLLSGSTVAVFVGNSMAVAYLRKAGGTCSSALNTIVQRILRWAETLHIVLAPQFIMGRNNVLADSLSRPNQIQGSEWTPKMEVFLDLRKKLPVMIDLFATSSNHCCSLYFCLSQSECPGDGCTPPVLGRSSGVRLPTLVPDSPSTQEAPFIVKGVNDSDSSILASAALVPRSSGAYGGRAGPVALPLCPDLLRQPHFHRRHLGIRRLSFHAWRLSSASPKLRDFLRE